MEELSLDSRLLEHLVQVGGPPIPDRCDLLEAAGPQSLRIVLASAWQAEGETPNPSLAYEVEFWRGLVARYRRLNESLSSSVPGLRPIKGFRIGRLYPDGWVRDCCDLDLVADCRKHLWQAADWLRSRGWEASGMAVVRVEGHPEVVLSLTRPSEDPWLCALETVEISSLSFAGNGWTVPAARRLPGGETLSDEVLQIAALLEERCERSYRARDALDALVLLDAMAPSDVNNFLDVVDGLKLWPEWTELALKVAAFASLRGDTLLRGRRTRGHVASALTRGTRGLLSCLSPGRVAGALLERWTVRRIPDHRRLAVSWWVHEKLHAERVLASGRPLFGLRSAGGDLIAEDLAIKRKGRHLWAETPLGAFVLLYSGIARPSWFPEGADGPGCEDGGSC